jgi:integrase
MASIQQHRNRWRVKWRDGDGRVLYESYATKPEAERARERVEAITVLDGRPPTVVDPDAMTLAKWWARWEPGREWRQSSRDTHAIHWRRYINPVFGRMPLEQITTADVRRWHRRLEAKGLAPRTVAAIHRTLSGVLQGAVEDELLARNPASAARLRKPAQTPPVALSPVEERALHGAIDETTPALGTFARFLAQTGLRRAEAVGLTWDRVDLDAGELTVDRQIDYSAPRLPAWSATKNNKTRRVPLTPATVELLRAHRAAQPVIGIKDALVFVKPDGRAWPPVTLQNAWHRAARALAADGTPLPDGARGWHTLRHTVASRLLEAGIPPAETAQLLGHTPATLLATYSHVTDRAAADARIRAALS